MSDIVICKNCGAANPASGKFCTNCGGTLEGATISQDTAMMGDVTANNDMPQYQQPQYQQPQYQQPQYQQAQYQQPQYQQPQYQQPYQNPNYANNGVPYGANSNANSNEAEARKFAVITLVLSFIAPIGLGMDLALNSDFLSTLSGLSALAGFVMMIIGRCKYPKNVMLKVIMIVDIVIVALDIIVFIAAMAFCGSLVGGCSEL